MAAFIAIIALFAAAFFNGISVQAVTYNWIGSVDNNYTNPAAWDQNAVPGAWDTANIGNATLTNATVFYTNALSDPLSTNNLFLLQLNNAAGTSTFNMTDGMLVITNGSASPFTNGGTAFNLGTANGAVDTFNQSGGTFIVARPSNNSQYYQDGFQVGGTAGANGTYSISGGLVMILCGTELSGGNPSTGTFTVSGGTVIDNGWFGVGRGNNGNGTFNMSGGTMYILRNPGDDGTGADGGVALSQGNPGRGTANISGGTLYCTQLRFNSSASANQALNISGGTLYVGYIGVYRQGAAASQNTTISGGTFHTADMIQVLSGGTSVGDTNTILSDGTNWSWDINLPVNLTNSLFTVNGMSGPGIVTFAPEATRTITLNSKWSGVGGFVVNGPGTVVMAGANSYTGTTTISQGTLALIGSGAIASSTISVAGGAVLDGTGATFSLNAGQTLTNTSAGAVVNGVKLGSGTASITYDGSTPPLIVASGKLMLSSNTVFNINDTGAALGGGSYKIVSSTGGSVGGSVLPLVNVGGGGTSGGGPVVLYVHNGELYLAVGFYPPPEFTTQPASTNLVLYSLTNHLILSAEASSSILEPVTYQWYTNGVADTSAGASSTYVGLPATATNYYCVASNLGGAATSEVVSVTYVAPPTTPYPSAVLSATPIGYWRLNEPDNGMGNGNAGVLANDYLGGNDGIYTNANLGQPGYSANNTVNTDPTETAAQFGFNGFNDNDVYGIDGVDFSTPAGMSATFTVEAWVNGYQQTADAGIVSKGFGGGGEQFDLDTGSDGGSPSHSFRFLVRDASGAAHGVNSSVQPGTTWHHLVGVCDEVNSNLTLYVDGRVAGTAVIAPGSGILTSDRPMLIGARPSSATSLNDLQFVGSVDDVAVYNRALSAAQVASQYFSAGIAPSFVQAPTQSTNADENGILVVPALATGTPPLSYQWYNANNNQPLAGQTNATLVISNLTVSDNYFNLIVTGPYGSTNAYVTVNISSGPPNIVSNLAPSSLTVYTGKAVAYSIMAQGTEPFYYKWYQDGSVIPNATNAAYTQVALSGSHTYSCTVSNTSGGGSITPSITVTLIGGPALPTNAYPLAVLGNNPIAFWRLDEGPDNGTGNNGTIANDYVGGHNASYSNVILGVSGYNSSLDSDTAAKFGVLSITNSYAGEIDESGTGLRGIDFATPAGNNAEFSVEAWVNGLSNTVSGNAGIVTKGYFNGEELDLDCGASGNDLRFEVRNAAGTAFNANSTINANATGWHHLVGVCDEASGLVSLYIDGNLAGTAQIPAQSGIFNSTAVPLSIGSRATSAASGLNNQFKGIIDDVAIYNFALSSNQVSAHYQAGLQLAPTLSIQNLGNQQFKLTWNTGTLQSSTNAAGPYNNATGANSPYTVPATNSQMFYRVLGN